MSVRTSTQNVLLARPRLFFKDGSPSTKAIMKLKSTVCTKAVSAPEFIESIIYSGRGPVLSYTAYGIRAFPPDRRTYL